MELWIRSQDKRTLINTRRVDIDDKNIIVWDEGRYADEIYLGSYSSPKRALEVLDEIQRKIENLYALENCSLEKNSCIEKSLVIDNFNIYQMPKE